MNAPATQQVDDRRAAVMAVALVAAVVIVIGFGSGIGSVLSHNTSSALPKVYKVSPSIARPIQNAGLVDVAGSSSVGTKLGRKVGVTSSPTPSASLASDNMGTAPSGAVPVAPCSGEMLTSAMLNPFFVHFDKAHLETSPGQQVSDATNVDQYTKTHTVLIEAMWTPLVSLLLGAPDALSPFVVHFDKAHLETSPGQQVSDATNVDQYTKTHTVLIENMLAPVFTGVTAAGC
jgi:hypothetical protein